MVKLWEWDNGGMVESPELGRYVALEDYQSLLAASEEVCKIAADYEISWVDRDRIEGL